MKRTYCGDIDNKSINETLTVKGWVNTRRDHGGVIFIDLRDHTGIIQIVFNPNSKKIFDIAQSLRSEFVLEIKGVINKRLEGTINKDMPTGEIELIAKELLILNTSKTPPFKINDEKINEDLRLQYRYIDLRSSKMQDNLRFRSNLYKIIRNHLSNNNFNEIETPILTKPTPEGARDYLVPSRVHKASFFALPQSPQIFKQLLMISGMDKYFQIAKCFRDEDLRADRQPEFTQLDIECSFCNEDDIINLTESLMNNIFKSLIDKDSNLEYPRMRYEDAMKKYGCDKPDLRNPLELEDITQLMIKTEFKVFKDCTGSEKKRIVALNVPNGSAMSRKNIDKYTELVKNFGAKGLAYFKIDNVTDIEKGIISPIRKFLSDKEVEDILDIVKPKNGDLIFFSADTSDIVNSSMSSLINVLGKDLDIIEEGYKFLWITDYPMFEYENNTDKLTSLHHPFTSPSEDTKDNFTDKTLSRAYDLTLNGNEIGGGSVRIHNKSLQLSVFKALGLTDEEIESKFGFFLQALDYGCPPHAGIAFGLDRLVMILMHLPSIRDSIAFPKTQSSACLLTDAPTEISASQLSELSIKTNKIN